MSLLLCLQLNIHKFKFIARFGLMHMVATNVCVWIRTLVRESLKEINEFRVSQGHSGEDYMIIGRPTRVWISTQYSVLFDRISTGIAAFKKS